mgnify:FL=1
MLTLKNKGENLNKYGWQFISIALVLFLIFLVYPAIESLILSMHTTKGIVKTFSGLANFKRMITDPMFKTAISNTFVFLLIQVPIMLIMAIFLANLLNSKKLKMRAFYRIAIFLPCVTSLVAYSVLFKMMFSNEGLINHFFLCLYLIKEPIIWLQDPFWSKVVIILALLWRWTGYNMIFFLAGLQNINPSLYEAAEIDGANKLHQFFYITVPQLKPIILFTAVMSTIGTLQLFDEPMNLTVTNNVPLKATMTIAQYIYMNSFVYAPNFGYAATLSYAVVAIIALLSIVQFKIAGDEYDN